MSNDGRAVAALVVGIASLFVCPLIGGGIAIWLGISAKGRIRKDPSRGGDSLATAGIALGATSFLLLPVLVAIAIPTFLGARARAEDRAAESSARSAMTAARVIWTQQGSYDGVTPERLSAQEPAVTFVRGRPSAGPFMVSVSALPGEITFAVRSKSGTCFAIRDTTTEAGHVTRYARGRTPTCTAYVFTPDEYSPFFWRY